MSRFTKVVKFMPESDAASFAESRSVRGMRMVTETSSESARYDWISVGEAPAAKLDVLHRWLDDRPDATRRAVPEAVLFFAVRCFGGGEVVAKETRC